jgi:hypothetical protein
MVKENFTAQIQGHSVEFTRVSYSAFDNWYHVKTLLNKIDVVYRMREVSAGTWKIKTPRVEPFILNIERQCGEEIMKNEASG